MRLLTKKLMSKVMTKKPTPTQHEDLANRPYSDEELEPTSEMKERLEKLMEFFDSVGIDYDKFDPESIPRLDLDRKAYPNYEQYMHVPGQRNTEKWLETVRTLYFKEKNGINRVQAIREATSGWNVMETFDFLNWLKYYEEGSHLKYKVANLWYENDAPGYFLHIKKDPEVPAATTITGNDIDNAKEFAGSEMSAAEKKSIIEKQRQKIIGRLDSAEKLLRSQDGQMFAGKELESLMESIYTLKKKIQLVNKLSTSVRLYEDMIIRQANVLKRNGFSKAAETLYSVAQTPAQSGESAKSIGNKPALPAPPAPPGQGSGSAGGLPSVGPGQPQNPPESAPNETAPTSTNKSKGISQFLEGMETSNLTTNEDKQANDDELEVSDFDIVVEAQAIEPAPTMPKLEVPKPDLEAPATNSRDFDNMIDAAFANLTINDVVAKLEDLAKVFKTREIPRQLSIVDMMLDSLGLASFFPSLSEATNKALESNNYISTRVEDILSKLRGSMATKDIDLRGDDSKVSPDIEGIKNSLKNQEEKEKARKQMRKDIENEELEGKTKETPEIDIKEDLGEPKVPAAPKVPAVVPTPKPMV